MKDEKDKFLLQILIGEIGYHVESAEKAYLDYLTARKRLSDPTFIEGRPSVGEVFRCLHSFLNHCVLICNILFPIQKQVKFAETADEKEEIRESNKRKAYRKKLLKKYIKEGGLLDPLRAIRNRFEHFDEDLDEWIATTKHSIYMSRNIFDNTALSKAIKIGDIPAKKLEKEIQPFAYIENNTLKYWGKQYDIEKAYNALVKLEGEVKQLDLRNRLI